MKSSLRTTTSTALKARPLQLALIAGIHNVISRQDYLNQINVFPVPDADTGTNMATTLSGIEQGIVSETYATVHALAAEVADCALQHARGNSGAILAQFFQGISEACQDLEALNLFQLSQALLQGAQHARQALAEPREGTMLTVMQCFAHAFAAAVHANDTSSPSLIRLLQASIKKTEKALAHTPDQLKELKKAKVVDAGAQGFVDFLHGVQEYLATGIVKTVAPITDKPAKTATPKHHELRHDFRYCTECLVVGENISLSALRQALTGIGHSLVIAGSAKKAKVHIHVNDPEFVFSLCQQYGRVEHQKADDMMRQQSLQHKEKKIAILTDSAADIPEELLHDYDIHIVPLSIQFGEKSFIDKVTLSSEDFYGELQRNRMPPKTSQPSTTEFDRMYRYLHSHYQGIVAIHMSSKISGTYSASKMAAQRVSTEIPVMDTLNACAAQGLVVTYAAMAAQAGLSAGEVYRATEKILDKTKLYAAIPNLKYAVRGGRVSRKKKWAADLLRLTPILSFSNEGVPSSCARLRGRRHLARKLAKHMQKNLDPQKTYRFAVVHANNASQGQALLNHLLASFPKVKSSYLVNCGAVIGAHSGPNCLAVAVQEFEAW